MRRLAAEARWSASAGERTTPRISSSKTEDGSVVIVADTMSYRPECAVRPTERRIRVGLSNGGDVHDLRAVSGGYVEEPLEDSVQPGLTAAQQSNEGVLPHACCLASPDTSPFTKRTMPSRTHPLLLILHPTEPFT